MSKLRSGSSPPEIDDHVFTGKLVVAPWTLLEPALTCAPPHVREALEKGLHEVAGTLTVTVADVKKAVREVAGDLNLNLSERDVELAARELMSRHLEEPYLRERLEDHLGEQAEKVLQEFRYDFNEGG